MTGYSPDVEIDERDPHCDHFLLFRDDLSPTQPIGTIRYYPPQSKLGRLAVLKEARGGGAGAVLVRAMEESLTKGRGKTGDWIRANMEKDDGLKKGEVTILCYSQAWVERFYAKLGYKTEGDVFQEEGQPHVKMLKTVKLDL